MTDLSRSAGAGESPTAPTSASPTAPRASAPPGARRAVALWLMGVAGLVALMVVVGGITRLTESGLSIVYWKPVSGILPPLSQAAWEAEFALYRTSPEYMIVNQGMSLGEFQVIYWWEYGHRLLGRLIGLAFAVPLLGFALARRIPQGYGPRLLGLLALGGAQGIMGWYMVQSGLVDEPEVSQYRLAAHFMLAMAIFAALMWTALDLLRPQGDPPAHAARASRPAVWVAAALLALIAVQLCAGAFVAGLKAGHVYNTWPLMGDRWLPFALWDLRPAWVNVFENPATVQFVHRMTGYVLVAASLGAGWWMVRRDEPVAGTALALAGVCLLQMTLGIATLLAHVPVALGAAHQAGGVAVLTLGVILLHRSLPAREPAHERQPQPGS
ncbi:hypothetical protein CCR85_10460 [Rhodothalassium salexigens]|uniref:COX15/CtaA family protein n=1 Tax=Rhodothalassium salexigens TaxID=1086 RepID=UPI001A937BD8|nr:COX15/CtaA family protein [Rhodothalassium salexigens]MBK5911910.1 hypothetical protein [Rhodothalassium salexigens]MBK5921141.1 hypothetical protein [Rhodothalassium salexigens]